MSATDSTIPIRPGPELLRQTVVIIGGSAGIGLETARRARAEGASIILTGRNRERLEQAARELGSERTAAFDANDPASLQSFFQDLPTQPVMVGKRLIDLACDNFFRSRGMLQKDSINNWTRAIRQTRNEAAK